MLPHNTSSVSIYEKNVPLYMIIFSQFVNPVFTFCGIIGNSWILYTLLFQNVRISKTTKLYYCIIGVGDLSFETAGLMWGVVCDSLWIWSGGTLSFCFDSLSLLSCTVIRLWYYLSDLVSNYSLVALSIERLIAVCWPLHAKSILTRKVTFLLLFSLLIPAFVYYTIIISFSSSVVPHKRVVPYSCRVNDYNIFGYLFNVSMPIVISGIHTIVEFFVSLMIFIKLYFAQNKSHSELNSQVKTRSKDLSATLTLLSLCIINILIYGTCLVSYSISLISSYFIKVSAEFYSTIYAIFLIFLSSLSFSHGVNIFVYLILIPSFRESALCKNKRLKASKFSSNTAQAQ